MSANPENCGDLGHRCGRLQPARGADEDRTLAPSGVRSDLIDPAIAAIAGGSSSARDGSLIEFRSTNGAAPFEERPDRAQRGPAARSAASNFDGIHLGDVVEESDGDLIGDGVNIAARLEGIAQPGAICLTIGN